MRYLILLLPLVLSACIGNGDGGKSANNVATSPLPEGVTIPPQHPGVIAGELRPVEDGTTYNPEAVVPPQCYTRHEATYNPCMTCHQSYPFGDRPNSMNDGGLQASYDFSDIGVTNHWTNLFEDRSAAVAAISDQQAIDYIYEDNYTTLIEQLEANGDWRGPIPAIEDLNLGTAAFDELGFARDGSHWVAFNYKPLPSTFWPTNGSTDDVMIRLPEPFRSQSCNGSGYSRDTYIANLAILEAAIKNLATVSLPAVDEQAFCADLNGDGQLGVVTEIQRPSHYVGNASGTAVTKMLYPVGTEFLHTVRYVGINADGSIGPSSRMKEVRYMRKFTFFDDIELRSMYGNERQEKTDGALPNFVSRGDEGLDNGFGWMVLGFIEAAEGHLRKQSEEEHLFCMGCHTTIGTTIDQTFAFPRKVTGVDGWGYIDLKGMADAPNIGESEGEILTYFKRVGGGNEFRENDELLDRWFNADGTVKQAEVAAADVYTLIAPSVHRALTLNKAYMAIVSEQDFIHGRDATVIPAANVYSEVDPDSAPVLPQEKQYSWDIRLDW